MGVQILNKDVSLISSIIGKAKANIADVGGVTGWAAAVGFQANDFNFEFLSGTEGDTNTITFTKSGTVCIKGERNPATANTFRVSGNLNGNALGNLLKWYDTDTEASTTKQSGSPVTSSLDPRIDPFLDVGYRRFAVVDVSINDTLYFNIYYDGNPFDEAGSTITFTNQTFNGTVIDTITSYRAGGCYLTTATVQYKGLADDGPELMAMRTLREYYRGDSYYDDLIAEYYQNSPIILNGISNNQDPASEYEFIYQSILRVKAFVDNNQWEEAKDEYISTYIFLKNKYID